MAKPEPVSTPTAPTTVQAVPVVVMEAHRPNVEETGQVQIDAVATKEDLVAIGVSREENVLYAAKSRLEKSIASHKRAAGELRNKFQNESKKVITQLFSTELRRVSRLLEHLGFGKHEGGVTATPDADKRIIEYAVSIVGASKSSEVPLPVDILAHYNAATAEDKAAALEETQLLEVRAAINAIPRFERQLKATLAEHTLNQTAKGQKLLNMLTANTSLTKGLKFLTSGDAANRDGN